MFQRPPVVTLFPYTTLFRSVCSSHDKSSSPRDARRTIFVMPMPYSDRKSTRLNSSHVKISYAVFCLKKKKKRSPRSNMDLCKYTSIHKSQSNETAKLICNEH